MTDKLRNQLIKIQILKVTSLHIRKRIVGLFSLSKDKWTGKMNLNFRKQLVVHISVEKDLYSEFKKNANELPPSITDSSNLIPTVS